MENNKEYKIYAAFSFGLVCLLIGIPVWWKTTEVYRVALPYHDIYSFHKSSIIIKINIGILKHENSELNDYKELSQTIRFFLSKNDNFSKNGHLIFKYNIFEKAASDFEANLFRYLNNDTYDSFKNKNFGEERSFGEYSIYIISLDLFPKIQKSAVIIGSYIVVPYISEEQVAKSVTNVLEEVLICQGNLEYTYQNAKNNFRESSQSTSKSLRSSLSCDITFTLLNPQPDMLNVEWDIGLAIENYIGPMLNSLSSYIDIVIKSQCIYQTSLNVKLEKSTNGTNLLWSSLPHTINLIEPYLSSYVSNGPSLNLVVYIPTRDQSPLHIINNKGENSPLNSFLSSRWGSLLIYNVLSDQNATLPQKVKLNMQDIFGVFVPQMKTLLGFQEKTLIDHPDFLNINIKNDILQDTELGNWLLKHCVENIAKSSATLVSLAKLLDKIRNIVINDDVGNRVEAAFNSMKKSVKFLEEGNINGAFLQSRSALEASEKAFYDPSILELLYFPEDQKYAIYIPLFLPIGIPIIQSLFTAFKYLKGKNKSKKKKVPTATLR